MSDSDSEDFKGKLKDIWLAGLGAYGKAVDEAQDQYGKVNENTSRLFDELLAKGKKLDGEAHVKLAEMKEKSSTAMEESVTQLKSTFSMHSDRDELLEKIDELSQKVDKLIDAVEKK